MDEEWTRVKYSPMHLLCNVVWLLFIAMQLFKSKWQCIFLMFVLLYFYKSMTPCMHVIFQKGHYELFVPTQIRKYSVIIHIRLPISTRGTELCCQQTAQEYGSVIAQLNNCVCLIGTEWMNCRLCHPKPSTS